MKKRSDYPRIRKKRYSAWLDAVYEHLKKTGETRPVVWLLENIATERKNMMPPNVNSATQKMRIDKRFVGEYPLEDTQETRVYQDRQQGFVRVMWWRAAA
jgi:hypothetical protein